MNDDGKVTKYTYNYLNRKISKSSQGIGNVGTTYTYDRQGSMTGINRYGVNIGNEMTAEYNVSGQITKATRNINADGVKDIQSTYIYDGSGRLVSESYAGYTYDEGTGFWNAGAREYDPQIKRFTSEDPENGNITDPVTTVKYVYANNNPVMNADPTGRSTETFCQAVCRSVVGAAKTALKVWEDVNSLIDKVPAPVKVTVGIAGAVIAVATGAEFISVAVLMTKAIVSGAVINGGTYAVLSIISGEKVSVRDIADADVRGALDGMFFEGLGLGLSGVGKVLSKNSGRMKAGLDDELGEMRYEGGRETESY